MDIKKLKEEIHKESYRSDPRSLIDVIDVDTLIDIIEELQAKNNEVVWVETERCNCPPLVACEICGEEKNLDGDFWKNKKKHDC